MEEKILQTIIAGFIKELISESKTFCSEFVDEAAQFLGKDITSYLEKQKEKYSYIKTLLHGNKPVYLYEIYYPINLLDGQEIVLTQNVNNIFKKSSYITILGDAGSGKTTLSRHLFLTAIKEKIGIPILLELRYLNETDGDIEKYILEKIFENKLSQNHKILARLLENGKFIFFLDGFDELNNEIKNKVVHNLSSFINTYSNNKYILTSRPYSNIESFQLFTNLIVKSLDQDEINGFIDYQLKLEKELATKIKKSITENQSKYIESFLANPLLLSLYILTFQSNAEIPDKKYIFYRRVINALFSEHDSKTKLGYVREKQSKLNQEQFEEILKAFCFVSYFESKYDFDYDYINATLRNIKSKIKNIDFDINKFIHDLKSAVALWTEDNGQYAFAHRSLQEYFAASFIKNLNASDSKVAYEKISNKYLNETKSWELQNFLSLCQEMDEINFYQFFYLPLLKETISYLNPTSELSLLESFVLFFASGFIFGTSKDVVHHPIEINPTVYRGVYFHLPYTQSLNDKIYQVIYKNNLKNHPKLIQHVKDGISYLPIKNGIPKDILSMFASDEMELIKDSKRFYSFLENEINRIEKFIADTTQTDKELLNLI